MKFALIGDGRQARYHRAAIKHIGGEILYSIDPRYGINGNANKLPDYIVICSPTHLHREQTKQALARGCKVIVEKPAVMPWEPLIDNDDISVVFQHLYIEQLPTKAEVVEVSFVRDDDYFASWKGDPMKTGGLFYNLFIHYIYLAKILGAEFRGEIRSEGIQFRNIHSLESRMEFGANIDLLAINTQSLYNKMYRSIINGNGIKPSQLYYLHYLLTANSQLHGFGRDAMNKGIRISPEEI